MVDIYTVKFWRTLLLVQMGTSKRESLRISANWTARTRRNLQQKITVPLEMAVEFKVVFILVSILVSILEHTTTSVGEFRLNYPRLSGVPSSPCPRIPSPSVNGLYKARRICTRLLHVIAETREMWIV